MTGRSLSLFRRLAVAAALLVPLVIDPFGADTQGLKALALALCGSLSLVGAGLDVARGRRGGGLTTTERLLLALVAWHALSAAWSVNPSVAWTRTCLLVGVLGVARGVRATSAGLPPIRRWLVGMVVVALLAMVADAAAILSASGELALADRKYASLLFVHNNMAATYVTMLAPVMVAFLLGTRPRGLGLLWLVPLGLVILYLERLESRAGTLAALLSAALVAALFVFRRRIERTRVMDRRWAVPLVLLVLLLAVLPFSDDARGLAKDGFNRVVAGLGLDLGDVVRRPYLWRKTAQMAFDHPLRGVGAGNFVVVFPRYEHLRAAMPHAHNDALQVLAETGIVGLLLFLGLLVSTAWSLARTLASGRGTHAYTMAAAVAGSLVVFVVGGLFEVPFALGATAANLAILLGLAGSMAEERPRRGRAASDRVPAAVAALAVGLAVALTVVRRLPASMYLSRARAAQAAGDVAGALEAYGRLADLGTGVHLPARNLAQLELGLGDQRQALDDSAGARAHYQAAREHIAQARELWPFGPDVMEEEGDVLFRLGRYDGAVERFDEAVGARPDEPGPRWKLVNALERAGRVLEAIRMLEYEVRVDRQIGLDKIARLSSLWEQHALNLAGQARTEALVAARHFCALLIEDGDVVWRQIQGERFKHLTHLLQSLPGSPDSWWPVYQRWRDQGGWSHMPNTALFTSIDADGVKLYPGWKLSAGPPLPRSARH